MAQHVPSCLCATGSMSFIAALLCAADADDGVKVDNGGRHAECFAPDTWLGVRGRPGVLTGAYQFEVVLTRDCLMRVGWAASTGRRALGTDKCSFAYGGTAMKSNGGKFEPYGEVHEGKVGAVVSCLVDRRKVQQQSISFCVDGRSLGIAFKIPTWLADVALFPAICGREDWAVDVHFHDLAYLQTGYRALGKAFPGDVVDIPSLDQLSASRSAFAAAPVVKPRELQQFDVPDENVIEFRSRGDESLDLAGLQAWLQEACGGNEFHIESSDSGHVAIASFATHQAARGIMAAPPPHAEVAAHGDLSGAAVELLSLRQPRKKATTDRVARRFIAGALQDDPTLTKEQLRHIRQSGSQPVGGDSPPGVQSVSVGRRAPPAPPMPLLEPSAEELPAHDGECRSGGPSGVSVSGPAVATAARRPAAGLSDSAGAAAALGIAAPRQRAVLGRGAGAGGRLLAGALRGLGAAPAGRG